MERLTKETVGCFGYDLADHKHEIGEFASYDAFYNYSMAVKRLGEYEDTGLTPEEINRIVDAYGRGHTLRSEHSERIEIIREISTDRLRELAQADKDGRLYTTPAKVGDEVYCIFHDKVADKWFIGEPEKIVDVGTKGFFLAVDLRAPDSPDEFHPWDEIGDEFFLTREEAEAALKGGNRDA